MPLARIITDSVEDSLELTIQLRARGFQVETVSPGEVPNTLVDLEVRLEECSPEDVLTRAAESSQEVDDLWVFVAPGALDDRVRPIREVSLMPAASPAQERPAAPSSIKAPYAKPVVDFNVPEDDLLLCELQSQAASAGLAHMAAPSAAEPIRIDAAKSVPPVVMASTVVREVERELPEVVVFPKPAPKITGPLHAAPPVRREAGPADMKFWRIASAVAVLAIAALIFGANLSREPQAVTSQAARVPVAKTPLQRSVPVKKVAAYQPPTHLKPGPVQVATAASPAPIAKKPAAQQSAGQKVARHHSVGGNDDIAQDTVVYYDGRGSAVAKTHSPSTKQ